jgi:phosphoenolpyruvate-protein kinase (PTS system EI component)
VIRLVDMTVKAAKARDIPVAVCGESAADPVMAALWIGLGVTSLSMGASGIPVVRKVLRGLSSTDVAELADKVRAMCDDSSAADIYGFCRKFLLERVPDFEAFQT